MTGHVMGHASLGSMGCSDSVVTFLCTCCCRGMDTATITVHRLHEDITVELRRTKKGWKVTEAVDEGGRPVTLTFSEQVQACSRADDGEDETGR